MSDQIINESRLCTGAIPRKTRYYLHILYSTNPCDMCYAEIPTYYPIAVFVNLGNGSEARLISLLSYFPAGRFLENDNDTFWGGKLRS
jgi:hypothetical protein